MVSVTYGIRPYGGHATGWTSPRVIALLAGGVLSLAAFALIERRVADPMFRLPLFRIRAFTFGTLSTFLSAVARGGLLFMLIIWLQGIWLPLHGYDFTETPLWAGIYMLPLTLGMLVAGPTSGYLSDRFGARWFATGGMLGAALSFLLLSLLPVDFSFGVFAAILALNGISMGMFASPNRAAVMNSLPPGDRGAGGGMNQTFQNSAQVLSIGIFFTLMILGLSATLPHALSQRPAGARRGRGERASHLQAAASVDPVRRLPWLQPDPAPRRRARARGAAGGQPGDARRPLVLPPPDLLGISQRPARGVRVRDHRLPDRRGSLADARRQVPLRRTRLPQTAARTGGVSTGCDAARAGRRASVNSKPERSSMQVEWYGQSAFRLSTPEQTVFIDPFADLSPMAERGMQFDYPADRGRERRPAARHPRAHGPQRRRGDRR